VSASSEAATTQQRRNDATTTKTDDHRDDDDDHHRAVVEEVCLQMAIMMNLESFSECKERGMIFSFFLSALSSFAAVVARPLACPLAPEQSRTKTPSHPSLHAPRTRNPTHTSAACVDARKRVGRAAARATRHVPGRRRRPLPEERGVRSKAAGCRSGSFGSKAARPAQNVSYLFSQHVFKKIH
jgi:hypothetical protein